MLFETLAGIDDVRNTALSVVLERTITMSGWNASPLIVRPAVPLPVYVPVWNHDTDVGVLVGVFVGVFVGVGVLVGVFVGGTGVFVGVLVGVFVEVGVLVGAGTGRSARMWVLPTSAFALAVAVFAPVTPATGCDT